MAGTVTRLRTLSSGSIGGNEVVQLPPVRPGWRLPNLAEIGAALWATTTSHVGYLSHADPMSTAPRPTTASQGLVKNCDQPPGRVVCPTSIRWPSGSRI